MPDHTMEFKRNRLFRTLLSMSVFLFIISISAGWIIIPMFLAMEMNMPLVPGALTRAVWEFHSFPLDYSIYVFNVTNPTEVQNGGKAIVHEVGPFVFDEFKEKYDIEDHEENDTVSYKMLNTFMFQPEKSNGLTGEELITIPNPLLKIIEDSENSQGFVYNSLSAFVTAPFMDLFFRGFFIDCSHSQDELTAKTICSHFESGIFKGAKKFNATHFTISLMAERNDSNADRFTVLRGQQNINDLGKLIEVDGQHKLNIWSENGCNRFIADGFASMPFSLSWFSYLPEICLSKKFRQYDYFDGIPIASYKLDFEDIKNEKENGSCGHVCSLKGTMDISPYTTIPIIVSLPHFLHGDESLFKNIDGLCPNDNRHGTHIKLEIISGITVESSKRIQFNLAMKPVEQVASMKNLKEQVMPIFWVDKTLKPNPFVIMKLKVLVKVIKINNFIRWFTLFLSFIGTAYAAYIYSQRNDKYPIIIIY